MLEASFPDFSFDTVDPIYPAKVGRYASRREAVLRRGADCRAWLRARPEKVIAVVSHSGFLRVGVCRCSFANADYRLFDFAADSDALVEWDLTRHNGGGMGRSRKGDLAVESQYRPSVRSRADEIGRRDPKSSKEPVDEDPVTSP